MPFKDFLKISFNGLIWLLVVMMSFNFTTVTYLFYQAKGQVSILLNRQTFDEYSSQNRLTDEQTENLRLISQIKLYSVDSLAYKPTSNFTKIYNQKNSNILWVISASHKYKIEPYFWNFPLVGRVSYKGFFDKEKALKEQNRLISLGYDVDLRSVSAWSTLGWFSDPVLSNMLNRSKGSLCNLIFHELFHATYYAPSSVDYNENLASFIAHKATLQFLKNDSTELNKYIRSYQDNKQIDTEISKIISDLNLFYDTLQKYKESQKLTLKLQKFSTIYRRLNELPLTSKWKVETLIRQISQSKNAWFVDFEQYNSLQDSLEVVFNKNYNSSLRKMVQSLN